MKETIRYFYILLFLLIGTSLTAQEKCEYSYAPEKTNLEWTAYKFTEKTGVKGTFTKINVQNVKLAAKPLDVVKDLSFTISTDSISSNNPDRDQKIKTNFFGSVANGSEIKGSFSKVVGGPNGGTASLDLIWNGGKHSFPVTFSFKEEELTLNGTIDVLKMGLGSGLQKLNEVCSDLHKGSDGKSKLWPTVDIKVISTLNKNCKN